MLYFYLAARDESLSPANSRVPEFKKVIVGWRDASLALQLRIILFRINCNSLISARFHKTSKGGESTGLYDHLSKQGVEPSDQEQSLVL